MGKIFFTFVSVAILSVAFFAAGCKSEDSPKTNETAATTIGILLYRADDAYILLVKDAIQKNLGNKSQLITEAANNDQLTQDEQFDSMLERKVSAVIVNMVDTQAASEIVDKAKKAGVPVVFFNREPDLKSLKVYDKASFVGTVAMDAGKLQGDLIAKLWADHPEYDRNKDGKFQYIMFQGNADNPEALARTEHSVKQARQNGVSMEQLGETHVCNWDEDLARSAMDLALVSSENEVELVIANNDAMALGAIAALARRGYNKEGGDRFIPVVGVDATPEAILAIQKGIMSATVKQDAAAMGKAIATLVLNAVDGKDFLQGTTYAWDNSGVAIRIPYSPYLGEKD